MKIRVRDIVTAAASVLTVAIGVMSLIGNGTADDPTAQSMRMVNWFLSVSTVLYVVFAVQALLKLFARDRAASAVRALSGIAVALSGIYTVLVIVYASPMISAFISAELWRDSGNVLTLVLYILYIAVGVTALALSIGAVRQRTAYQQPLCVILAVCTVAVTLPTVIFSFQYDIELSLRITTVLSMLLPSVCQAITVCGAFAE